MKIELRGLTEADYEPLREMRRSDEVSPWWGPVEDNFPWGDEPTVVRFAIVADGELAGMLQANEETDPHWRYVEFDIFLGPDHVNRGIGSAALQAAIDKYATEKGHHRFTIGASLANKRAIACYHKAGFTDIGITRKSGLSFRTGQWEDELIMERVLDPPHS